MQIEKLFTDYHIPYVTEHKNVRYNWIGIHCPFCPGEQNYHLGYSIDDNYFSCWRCGGHGTTKTIAKILSVNWDKAEEIIKKYGGVTKQKASSPRVRVGTNKFQFPSGDLTIHDYHKRYLEKRNFDPERIVEEWGLLGTGPIAKLDDINYARRILAPIHWDGRIVSFQGRDITDKHMAKYMACPPEREIISHQHIVYGKPDLGGIRGVCVEGITDVWRLGQDSFAIFGIKFTRHQIRAIARLFEEVVIVFDPDPQAQAQALKLEQELIFKGVRAWREEISTDPGSLGQEEANYLMKQLMK